MAISSAIAVRISAPSGARVLTQAQSALASGANQEAVDEPARRPIADIALAVGCSGLSTFYRAFRAKWAATPGEFRDAASNFRVSSRSPER